MTQTVEQRPSQAVFWNAGSSICVEVCEARTTNALVGHVERCLPVHTCLWTPVINEQLTLIRIDALAGVLWVGLVARETRTVVSLDIGCLNTRLAAHRAIGLNTTDFVRAITAVVLTIASHRFRNADAITTTKLIISTGAVTERDVLIRPIRTVPDTIADELWIEAFVDTAAGKLIVCGATVVVTDRRCLI